MERLHFRPAQAADQPRILEIIRQAQAQMRALGSAQWQDGYPAPEDIDADIARGTGRVLCTTQEAGKENVIAYGAVIFDGEPAYEKLAGTWTSETPYVVVHRLAVADAEKGRGVGAEFMRRTELLARERGMRSLRIDTHCDNRYMLRLLRRLGFSLCGTVVYRSGERLAFEKAL